MKRTFKNKKTGGIRTERGFTIIELMVSMTVFIVIVTMGITAVLGALSQHRANQNLRSIMDNLNFTMEDMTRNIRLSANIDCVPFGTALPTFTTPTEPVTANSCPSLTDPTQAHDRIVFNDVTGGHTTYMFETPAAGDPTFTSRILKQKGDASALTIITPPEVSLDYRKSGFTVRGAEPGPFIDRSQPLVTIRLEGTVTSNMVKSNFAIQTTVALRALDS